MSTPMKIHPSNDEIAAHAYHIWLAEGCPDGAAERHWLEAEAHLTADRLHASLTVDKLFPTTLLASRPKTQAAPATVA